MAPREDNAVGIADAPAGNWVDAAAPRRLRPYLRLARLDRPIGAWLLLWPAWWSVALAAREAPSGWVLAVTGAGAKGEGLPDPILLVAFLIGAFAMRGAGCTYNDIVDRRIDARVARTAARPVASGEVSVIAAFVFLAAQAAVGLLVLLAFNRFAIVLGLVSLVVVAAYPFAKRVTYWPQAVLGLAFGWGALLGWAAFTGTLGWAPLALYAAAFFWIVGYDTIYAHQDKGDDVAAGVKSAALLLGARTRPWLAGFYGFAALGIAAAAWLAGVPMLPFAALFVTAVAQLAWQVTDLRIDDPADCLAKFRSNHTFGILVFAALIAAQVWGGQFGGGAIVPAAVPV